MNNVINIVQFQGMHNVLVPDLVIENIRKNMWIDIIWYGGIWYLYFYIL